MFCGYLTSLTVLPGQWSPEGDRKVREIKQAECLNHQRWAVAFAARTGLYRVAILFLALCLTVSSLAQHSL